VFGAHAELEHDLPVGLQVLLLGVLGGGAGPVPG
jgi:hypothetical protein